MFDFLLRRPNRTFLQFAGLAGGLFLAFGVIRAETFAAQQPSNAPQGASEEKPERATGEALQGREDAELTRMAQQIAKEVAVLRGLAFRSEVAARYADKATFLRYAQAMEEALLPPERRAAEPWVAKLLGWVPPDMDLRAVQHEVLAAQVGGFYDPLTKVFFVMEGLHPDMVRILLAHELTHALDDQHFDLVATDRRLVHNTDALLAHRAVLEGCAQVVMTRWMEANLASLDEAALIEYQNQIDMESLSKAPRYVWQPLFALYMRGQSFPGFGRIGWGLRGGHARHPSARVRRAAPFDRAGPEPAEVLEPGSA